LDNPQRVFGDIYHCAKFSWNGCSSLDNTQVLIFNEFGFKMPTLTPKIGFFGELTHRDPNNAPPVQKHVIRRIDR